MPAARKKTRDPEDTKRRILAAAKSEFAKKGLAGARVDVIAAKARANKRMMYHYFGNKDALFRVVVEDAYAAFRLAEAELELEKHEPVDALRRLVSFTWSYYLRNPEFITLVNSENLHKARHIRHSPRMTELNRPFVERMRNLLRRGVADGQFRPGLDAVQVLITIAAVNYYYFTNRFTGAIVYERELTSPRALDERLAFNIVTILRLVCTPRAVASLGGGA